MYLAVVAAYTVDVVVLGAEHGHTSVVPVHLEAQLLGQCVRLVESNHRPLVV